MLAMRCYPEQQQTRSASDLQYVPWLQRQNPIDCLVDPNLHLFSRDGLIRIAGIPSDDVEGLVRLRRWLGISLIEDHLPFRNLIRRPLGSEIFIRLVFLARSWHYVRHQSLIARLIFTGHNECIAQRGMLPENRFNL